MPPSALGEYLAFLVQTGSGKSTILDAITLALYGKVERAANNTQGIMNHAANQLNVSFTFQLSSHEQTKQYRVERAFKRTGEFTLRTSSCRLVKLTSTGEEMVLADKEREVTAAIGELLGLTIDDFTRAVVLPQGKFAEFLTLKGAERRQMLQRLFNLEQYGDRLNHRLKQRMENVRHELAQIKAEQQGLGDASLEAITALSEQVAAAKRQVDEQQLLLQQLEQQYEADKQIWQWQEELKQVQIKLNQLHTEKETVQQLEATLKRAQEAASLKPYAEEWRTAQESLTHWQQQETLLEKEVRTALERYEQSKQIYEAAQQERLEEEPKLLVRQEQLKQAQQIEAELSQAKAKWQQIKRSMQELVSKQQLKEKSLLREKELYEKAVNRQQELKQQITELQVPAELRVQFRQASEAKQTIRYQQQRLKELQAEREKQLFLLNQERSKQEQLAEQIAQLEAQINKQYRQAYDIYQQMEVLRARLEAAQQLINEEIKTAQQALEEEHHQQLAQQLVQTLQEGKPCPVCGSTEHPHPTARTSEQLERLDERKRHVAQLEHALREATVTQAELDKYAYHGQQLVEALREVASTEDFAPIERSLANLPTFSPSAVDQLGAVAQEYQAKLLQVEEKSKQSLNHYRELHITYKEQSKTVRTKEQDVNELEHKIKENNELIQLKKQRWQEAYPTLDYEQLEAEQLRMDQRDQQVTEINQRLEKSVTYISEREQAIQEAERELNQLQLTRVELETERTSWQQQIHRLEGQLREHLGIEADSAKPDISHMLEQVSSRLRGLKTKEQEHYETYLSQQKSLQEKEREHGIAKESLKQAIHRQAESEAKWQEQAQASGFEHIEEVFQALMSKAEAEQIEERINRYREQERQAQHEQARLTALLQGRVLTSEEWQKLGEAVETAKSERDEALQRFAKVTRDLEELQSRHVRFRQLAEQRLELEKQEEQIGKLTSVFRGNSFVEFVATEQLIEVSRDASYRLGQLTRQRYALEVDSDLGFVIRDDHNGGFKRPISSLSGGETFLTSLALALALSAQIQLRGEYPLEFFFLDEGFGTLDQELLDTVIDALEKLHTEHLSVGVISHVPELQARLPRQLNVQPASAEHGSRVSLLP